VKDAKGRRVEAKIEDLGVAFGSVFPKDKFRQPYMARKIAVTFEAQEIPAFGYATYYVEDTEPGLSRNTLVSAERVMENEFLRVEIHRDGSYTLTEKNSGHKYEKIGWYEETGDIGNEYMYIRPNNCPVITTKGSKPKITLAEDEPYHAVYEICHRIEVPASADETLAKERSRMTYIFDRRAGRSRETVVIPVTARLTLEKSARGVKVETTITNTAKDHRMRVMIPTGLQTNTHFADSVFEVVERKNHHSRMWKNPSGCEHQQNFVAMCGEHFGIMVANFGLYEYEVLPEAENTIAVTLIRAVGEMGDWGMFPTPEAQLQGTYTAMYEIVPFSAENLTEIYQEAYQFQTELTACQTEVHPGALPKVQGLLDWQGRGLNLTGLKLAENREDVMVRFVNNTIEPVMLRLAKQPWFTNAYKSNVIEAVIEEIPGRDGKYEIEIRPFEIVTIGLVQSLKER